MNITQVLEHVFNDRVGWRPVSRSIKPVHIANGMFRELVHEQHDIEAIIAFIVWWAKKDEMIPHEDRTFQKLVSDQPNGPFAAFEGDPRFFDKLRDLARAILGADGAVFPTARNSSLSLTCRQMISADPNDRGLGRFAAALIADGAEEGALATVLREALDVTSPDDPISTMVWPLLDQKTKQVSANPSPAMTFLDTYAPVYRKELRAAADTLATHERAQGNRLKSLQRAVHLACVSSQSHVQALVAGGDLDARMPALVSVRGARSSAITAASEASLIAIYDAFDRWLADQLAIALREQRPLYGEVPIEAEYLADTEAARAWFLAITGKADAEPSARDLASRSADFDEALQSFADAATADILGHALYSSYVREFATAKPRDFLLRIVRTSGLAYPYFQGNGQRRLRPTIAMLDMLVRACVESGHTVPLDEFLERLWRRFGLIIGGRGDGQTDAALLALHGIDVDPTALITNTEDLIDQMVSIGVARRYADNITFVGDGHAE